MREMEWLKEQFTEQFTREGDCHSSLLLWTGRRLPRQIGDEPIYKIFSLSSRDLEDHRASESSIWASRVLWGSSTLFKKCTENDGVSVPRDILILWQTTQKV
jgi:hypothetical protein